MSQIITRGIQNNAVTGEKVRLNNNQSFRARNAANNADIELFKLNSLDELEFLPLPKYSGSNIATESYVTNAISGFQNAFINKGAWDASTNTPTLADGVGTNGWTYRTNTPGTVDFGSGPITFQIGDLAVYNGTIWEKFDVIDNELPNSTTDDLAEGSTNLYHTVARARTAAVVNSMAGTQTDQAPSVSSVKQFIADSSANIIVQSFTLIAADITNGYVTLSSNPDQVIEVTPKGFPPQHPVDDYTITSGNRLTFAGDMLSLVVGDKIKVVYSV